MAIRLSIGRIKHRSTVHRRERGKRGRESFLDQRRPLRIGVRLEFLGGGKVSGPFFSAIVWLLVLIAWSMPPGAKGTGHLRSGWGSGLES